MDPGQELPGLILSSGAILSLTLERFAILNKIGPFIE